METGIYEILNTDNGKWYRGATEKLGFEERWAKHKWSLNAGTHVNSDLQEDWNEHGEKAFKFHVLSRCAPEFCDELEEYWIGNDYNDGDISYNMQSGGTNGVSQSEETRRKKSEAQSCPELTLKRRQAYGMPFTVTHPDGRVKGYLSTNEAAAELGVSGKTIDNYLKGKSTPGGSKSTASLKGCTFTYTKEQS